MRWKDKNDELNVWQVKLILINLVGKSRNIIYSSGTPRILGETTNIESTKSTMDVDKIK